MYRSTYVCGGPCAGLAQISKLYVTNNTSSFFFAHPFSTAVISYAIIDRFLLTHKPSIEVFSFGINVHSLWPVDDEPDNREHYHALYLGSHYIFSSWNIILPTLSPLLPLFAPSSSRLYLRVQKLKHIHFTVYVNLIDSLRPRRVYRRLSVSHGCP